MENLRHSANLDRWLSEHGKRLHFPENGIVAQATAAATKAKINATAGAAYEDNGNLMTLPSVAEFFNGTANTLNYLPTKGLPELRDKWLEEMHTKNPSIGDAPLTKPITTAGLTHGINIAGQLFIEPGSQVILADKYWDNYELMFEMGLHAKLQTFPTFNEQKDGYNIKGVEQSLLDGPIGKKFFVMNVPNNPTGYSPTQEEQDQIVDIVTRSAEKGNTIVVLCDDAYFGLNYDESIAQESIFAKLAHLHENIIAVKIDGATKEEFSWGARVGFITIGGKSLSPEDLDILENKIAGVIRSNTSNGSRPSQEALLNALKNPHHREEKEKFLSILKERFWTCQDVLEKNKEKFSDCFTLLPCNSGYFFCLEYNPKINGVQVRQKLLDDFGIGIISVDDWFRIAFSAVAKEQSEFMLQTLYEECARQL